MDRYLVAAGLIIIAVAVAAVLHRRRPDAPTQPSWTIPAQLDRLDFARPEAPWLVVTFTSATCDTCAAVTEKVAVLESDAVAVHNADAIGQKPLHDRYGIDAVPTLVIADESGVVRASFVGPMTATDLWATMANLRDPA